MNKRFIEFPNRIQCHERAEMRDLFTRVIKNAERQQLKLRVPHERGLLQKHPGMHFHFKPELFVQISGRTEFRFPDESYPLLPGEVGIVPAGVPHAETVFAEGDTPFRNLVVGLYSHTLSIHFAREFEPGRPDIDVMEFFDAPHLEVFSTLTTGLVQTFHQQAGSHGDVIKGLLITIFAMLRNTIETGSSHLNADVGKVFKVKWLVREQFANPELNVKKIAEWLQCSPDYLSHLFHRQTGEKLIHYIQRIRIESALFALRTTPLYVSEIAYASGFVDPAYFARVFKQHTGEGPQEYRDRIDAERREPEAAPKTVYFDSVDYTYGQAKSAVQDAS
jgi:AraC-like DNA-binding protein/mannose-6-phosphate isomerase-like protein (cupin superfamily)